VDAGMACAQQSCSHTSIPQHVYKLWYCCGGFILLPCRKLPSTSVLQKSFLQDQPCKRTPPSCGIIRPHLHTLLQPPPLRTCCCGSSASLPSSAATSAATSGPSPLHSLKADSKAWPALMPVARSMAASSFLG
jgi:hypothetical protein